MTPRQLGPVLVTGANGFLGAALVARLRGTGRQVIASDIEAGDAPCDITDFAQVEALFRGQTFGTVFHCGAVSGPMVLADQPLAIWQINALGTAHVLEAARLHAAGRVVVCSTTNVYGDLAAPVDERTRPSPNSVYAASKLAAENAVLGYVREHGTDAIALRLSWIYGPGRRTPTELENILRAALTGQPAVFSAAPDDFNHYLYIEDAVDGLICAGCTAAPRDWLYNIAAGPGVPVKHLVSIITNLRPNVRLALSAPQKTATGPTAIDIGRAKRDLGFSVNTELGFGLESYLEFLVKDS
ncbi:MAG: NAD(P)-dependent oxidoreductase [Alphaproteobacteria bacterium]|nr:NAD(P)-dependent oxidoreductase [Alphaproteobacteria bacterium]